MGERVSPAPPMALPSTIPIAVVTKPFEFEGEKRMRRALDGIEKLKKEVDTLIIIPNERLKALGYVD